mgnify:FL=1
MLLLDETATTVDITQLFLDAIRNRSGVLRFAMFDPDATSSNVFVQGYANNGNADDVRVELTNANARTTYWQPYNYTHLWEEHITETEPQSGHIYNQPHVNQIRMLGQSGTVNPERDVRGGHTVGGKLVSCNYALSLNAGQDSFANDIIVHTAVLSHGGANYGFVDSHMCTTDGQASTGTHKYSRTSLIWMADE